jgi:GT2 family glycosyltransferase
MRLSVILVHYHAAKLTEEAHTALSRDAANNGLEVEWLIVDNGSSAQERELLRSLPGHLLEPGQNLGFGGGVNLGVEASRGDVLLLMNPDVMVQPGCLSALLAALESGAAVVGPRFFWDRERYFLLPPTEPRGRWPELGSTLGKRNRVLGGLARSAWRRHTYRFWNAAEPYACFELSGALLALRRDAWEEVGPFDPAYPLYFEETDWLLRLRRCGLAARFVPQAEAIHFYAQSSRREPKAEEWFQISYQRFRKKHYGAAFSRFLEVVAKRPLTCGAFARRSANAVVDQSIEELELPPQAEGARWLEWSASPDGVPAAGCSLIGHRDGGLAALATAAKLAPSAVYFLRWVDSKGKDLARISIRI